MTESAIHVVCRLSDVEYSMIARACEITGTPIATFLTASGIRQAHAMGISSPYLFAGLAFATEGLTDAWYDATTEVELVAHLKDALRRGQSQVAQAMAIELLDFPADWSAIALNEGALPRGDRRSSFEDRELTALVASTLGVSLETSAQAWDCYKAIVRSASAACLTTEVGSQAKR